MSAVGIGDTFKKYGAVLRKGLVAEMAPNAVKGALIETLLERKVNVVKATEWVEKNVSLWDTLEPGHQKALRYVGREGSVEWLTPEWVIAAIRHDLPAVASLLLGWKKAHNWLVRQVEIIKEEVQR